MICDKTIFKSLSEAATAATGRSNAGRGKHGFKPYKCRECGNWHLTSKTKRLKHQINNLPPGTYEINIKVKKQPLVTDKVVFTMTQKLNLPKELISQFRKV